MLCVHVEKSSRATHCQHQSVKLVLKFVSTHRSRAFVDDRYGGAAVRWDPVTVSREPTFKSVTASTPLSFAGRNLSLEISSPFPFFFTLMSWFACNKVHIKYYYYCFFLQTQKVEYDFKYYKMDFDSDINVLILSEGKSLLPVCL